MQAINWLVTYFLTPVTWTYALWISLVSSEESVPDGVPSLMAVESFPRRTGNVEERDWWRAGLMPLPRPLERYDGSHLLLPAQQNTFLIRYTKCCRTRGVKTQNRKAFTNPWPESPIPWKKTKKTRSKLNSFWDKNFRGYAEAAVRKNVINMWFTSEKNVFEPPPSMII